MDSTFSGSGRILARIGADQKKQGDNMAQFVRVPPARLQAGVLQALLEDYASRDGTDYGAREYTLEEKSEHLRRQLDAGELQILYDLDSEQWDLLARQAAEELLNS